MSQIAALLLMYLNEEDAFWALSVLMAGNKYNMHGEPGRGLKLAVQWLRVNAVIADFNMGGYYYALTHGVHSNDSNPC